MKYFIAGFLIAFFFEYVSTIISYIVEWIKSAISVHITKNNVEIAKISSEVEQEQPQRVIGFQIPDDNWGESEDEE